MYVFRSLKIVVPMILSAAAVVPAQAATDCKNGKPCVAPCAQEQSGCCVNNSSASVPQGWKASLTSQRIVPKQNLYLFNVAVRNQAGARVDNARVYLRTNASMGSRTIPLRSIGGGEYQATTSYDGGFQDPSQNMVVVVEEGGPN